MAAINITAVRVLEAKRLLKLTLDLLDELYDFDELDTKHVRWIQELTTVIVVPLSYHNQYVTSAMEGLYTYVMSAWENDKKELFSLPVKKIAPPDKPIKTLPVIKTLKSKKESSVNDVIVISDDSEEDERKVIEISDDEEEDSELIETLEERDELIRNTITLMNALYNDQTGRFSQEDRDELSDMLQREILDELNKNVFENVQDDMIDLYNAIVNLYNGIGIEREEGETVQELIGRAYGLEHEGKEMTRDEVRQYMQSRIIALKKVKTKRPETKRAVFKRQEKERKKIEKASWDDVDKALNLERNEDELRRQRNELENVMATERGQYDLNELGQAVWNEQGFIDDAAIDNIDEAAANQEQLRLINELRDRQEDRAVDFNRIGDDVLQEYEIGDDVGQVEALLNQPAGDLHEDVDLLNQILDLQQEMLDRARLLEMEGRSVGKRAQEVVSEYENYNIEMSNAGTVLANTQDLLDGLNIEDINDEIARLRHEVNTALEKEVDPEAHRNEIERLHRAVENQHLEIQQMGREAIQGVNRNENVLQNAQQVEQEIQRDVRPDRPVELQQMIDALTAEVEAMAPVSDVNPRNEAEQYARYLELQGRIEELIQELQQYVDERQVDREGARMRAGQKRLEQTEGEGNLFDEILDLENENLMRARDRDMGQDRQTRDIREAREAAYLRELLEQMQDQWVDPNRVNQMYSSEDSDTINISDDDDGEIPEEFELTRENI